MQYEALQAGSIFLSVINLLGFGLQIAGYILLALGLYSIARRRGIQYPWMGWIPVANLWLIGSVSDQYQYVFRGAIKNKRKVLLTIGIVYGVLVFVLIGMLMGEILRMALSMPYYMSDEAMMTWASSLMLKMGGFLLLILPLAVTLIVLQYMAFYDIYRSCNPGHAVLFLVLSILIPFTAPFFVFCNRNSDAGMPPRKQQSISPMLQEFASQPEAARNADSFQLHQIPMGEDSPEEQAPQDF